MGPVQLSACARWRSPATWHLYKMPAVRVNLAAVRRAVTHFQEHPWVRHVHWVTERAALFIYQPITLWGAVHQIAYRRRRLTSVEELQHVVTTGWANSGSGSFRAPSMNGITDWTASSSNKEDTLKYILWMKHVKIVHCSVHCHNLVCLKPSNIAVILKVTRALNTSSWRQHLSL